MALYDENGKITIDENAAQGDIKKLSASVQALNDAINIVLQVESIAAGFEGKTATFINDASFSLEKKLRSLIADTENTINLINNTVKKYQQLDASLKNQINNSHM